MQEEATLSHVDPTDYPRDVIIRLANHECERYPGVELRFKTSCLFCGHRNMFEEPFKLFASCECGQCGRDYPVHRAGYALFFYIPRS